MFRKWLEYVVCWFVHGSLHSLFCFLYGSVFCGLRDRFLACFNGMGLKIQKSNRG